MHTRISKAHICVVSSLTVACCTVLHAVPSVCATCAAFNNQAVPVGMERSGTIFPTPAAADVLVRGLDVLQDGVLASSGNNFGAQAPAANYNWIQVQLTGGPYSDISYMRIAAGNPTGTSLSGFLTVWVSPTTNFTATGTKCVSGIGIIGGVEATVTCPAANGTQFVTIERRDPLVSDPLWVHELRVYRSSESRCPSESPKAAPLRSGCFSALRECVSVALP